MDEQPVAAIDAVRKGKFECTIRTSARSTDVEGALCRIETDTQIILGRIGRVDLTNPMHEDTSFKPLIMEKGSLLYFSGNADVEQTTVEIISCMNKATGKIESKKANPPSGTPVHRATHEVMVQFVPEQKYLMYIGALPTDSMVHMSVRNRHYGPDQDDNQNDFGGFGEAKHRGYFGRNGSGKTVMALTQLAGRLVQHPQLGCFIPDTAGDISLIDAHEKGIFQFSFKRLLERGGRRVKDINISDVRLESRDTLHDLLTKFFEDDLRIGANENCKTLAHRTALQLFEAKVDIDSVGLDDLLEAAAVHAVTCWTGNTGKQKAEGLRGYVNNKFATGAYEKTVRRFFLGSHKMNDLIGSFLNDGEIIILQLHTLNDEAKEFVMYEIFQNLTWQTENAFKKNNGQMVNSEIVLDEAPRWVGQGNRDRIANRIRDAAKNTRKYGLSWTFIGQRPANVDNDVISQMHSIWFGRGLGVGADRDHMERELGSVGLEEYDRLNTQGGFFWMGVGDEINLGVGTSYISVMSYGGDATERIINMNPHIWR
jgi:hypothetical protein